MKVEKIVLHKPDLEEVANVLRNGTFFHEFSFVDVQVVDCPDFTKEPFFLASEGICGSPCLAYVGGKEYLLPVVNRDKKYDFRTIAEQTNRKEVSILAAGAGPWFHIEKGSTMIGDLKLGETECINTRLVTVRSGQTNPEEAPSPDVRECSSNCDYKTGTMPLLPLIQLLSKEFSPTKSSTHKMEIIKIKDNTQFAIMANLYMSEGKPGKVIRVIAKWGDKTPFITGIRQTLDEFYEDKVVGMGGVFLIKKGNIKVHVKPPEFSETPLETVPEVNLWLKPFVLTPPLTCVTSFVSHDPVIDKMLRYFMCGFLIISLAIRDSTQLSDFPLSVDCSLPSGKIPRLFPHPTDCRSMFVCLKGRPQEYYCPNDQVFDSSVQGCLKSKTCSKNTDKFTAFEDCPPVNGKNTILFPHPTDCNMYYQCDHGVAYPRGCPHNLHFNPQLKVCDWPYRANCKARIFTLKSKGKAFVDLD